MKKRNMIKKGLACVMAATMTPWITGILAVSSPIFNVFIFSPTSDEIFRTVLPQSVLSSSDSFSAKTHPDLL